MSFKNQFAQAKTIKSLANKSAQEIASAIESVGFQEADIVREDRFIPQVDYSKPEAFARYGSAEEYYLQSINRVVERYPYDGSLKERAEWENASTYIDLYILDNEYPRTNGYINFCASDDGWGSRTGAIVSGYGLSDELEYITFYGGPHPNPTGMSPMHTQFTGSNYYEPEKNRESNLKFDLCEDGATIEFWLKKDAFDTNDTEKEVLFDLWNTEDTSSADYGRCRLEFDAGAPAAPVILTVLSGTTGFSAKSIADSDVTTATIADGTWKHYAVSMINTTGAKSIEFDGIDDSIEIGTYETWDALIGGAGSDAKPWTFSAWVYLNTLSPAGSTNGRILDFSHGDIRLQYDEAGGDNFSIKMEDGGGGTTSYTTSTLSAERWYHIVATYEGDDTGNLKVYLDGALEDTDAVSTPTGLSGPNDAFIGNRGAGDEPFDGYIDEVAIWAKALDSTEVTAIYNSGVPTDLMNADAPAGLLSWWPMGDNAKDTLDGSDGTAATTFNRIVDVAGGRDGWASYGNMVQSQIVPYSPTNNSVTTKFYVNGTLNKVSRFNATTTLTTNLGNVTKALYAQIGALTTAPVGSSAPTYAGKLSASLDEFRYWKVQRSSAEIGTFWFTQVGGGTNTDPTPYVDTSELDEANTHLGVYYKFNEGITGNDTTDASVLDYSGRVTNGTWTGYATNNSAGTSRNTGSAIVLSSAATKEFKDPIIYSSHPEVVTLKSNLALTGSNHDVANNASLYNSFPAWVQEEDSEGQKQAKYLTQILGSYFDTLHLQIEALNKLKDVAYVSGTSKPVTFAEHLPTSQGLIAPEIFLDADIFEKLADRSEDLVFEKTLNDVKNTIYKNIYNNLSYIYKSKGTEKAFRNLIRCFGIDEELIKINMYANNVTYDLQTNRKNFVVPKRYVNFNSEDNKTAVVYQAATIADADNPSVCGFVSGSTHLSGGYSYSLEAEIIFPKKLEVESPNYIYTSAISSSLFGIRGVDIEGADIYGDPAVNTKVPTFDPVNFQVYAVRDEIESSNVKFLLTSSNNGLEGRTGGLVTEITSGLYQDVYNNSKWNLAVVVKPRPFSLLSAIPAGEAPPAHEFVGPGANYLPSGSGGGVDIPQRTFLSGSDYVVEFHGVHADSGIILDSFVVTGSIAADDVFQFVTGSKRAYMGAFREDVTGSALDTSDVKISSYRFWLNNLEHEELVAHAYDIKNYGTLEPHLYAYPFDNSASFGQILKRDTLVFDWSFDQNTGSNAEGEFVVADMSSGSNTLATNQNRFGGLRGILGFKHPASGSGFAASTTSGSIDKEYVVSSRQQLPEYLQSEDMIAVLTKEDQDVFERDTRPVNYFFTFEKSMYQTISEEMLKQFATLKDINTLIGAPSSRYRTEYKGLKKLKQRFFEQVGNEEVDFDKYYEYYKWFDSTLSYMLEQLVPASTDFANLRTVIESHLLERPKYQNKFPFLDTHRIDLEGAAQTNAAYVDGVASPEDDPQGTGLFSAQAPTRRQLGLSTRTLSNQWSREHAPPDASPTQNLLWWRNRAEADNPIISSSIPLTNANRQMLQDAINSGNVNQLLHPYRFNAAGNVTFGGVGLHQNKRINYTYAATRPFGPVVAGTNIPQNIMLGFSGDLEPLIDTTETFFPSYKQRLGFDINPTINKDNSLVIDSNIVAPFSLYSSSMGRSGVNTLIYDNFATGATITNLHHDLITDDCDIPLQGPFTEKFVGGRENRHIPLNSQESWKSGPNNIDSAEDRPEAYKILLGAQAAVGVTSRSGAFGIVDPLYPEIDSPAVNPPYLYHRETAHRFRPEVAKRPVNIKNILMTTASAADSATALSGVVAYDKIGNYQKNYQVIQSAGRSQNDPFFQDQSFDFALFPETTATRGRFIGGVARAKSMLFDGSDDYISAGDASDWAAAIGGAGNAAKPFSFSAWIYFQSGGDTYPRIISVGDTGNGDRRLYLDQPGYKPLFMFNTTSGFVLFQSSDGVPTDTWTHVVATFDGGSDHGGSKVCAVYIDGAAAAGTAASTGTPTDIADSGLRIGAKYGDAFNFKGYMCDVAVWGSALKGGEITEIYNNGARVNLLESSVASNLLSWWKMGGDPRDAYNDTIYDQTGFQNGSPTNFPSNAIAEVSPQVFAYGPGGPTENVSGNLDYLLPTRTGNNSNQTIIVNRFSAPGSYDVMSQGYLDPAHEEKATGNALPFRNLSVISSGSGESDTMHVVDQLGYRRGLRTLRTLHCGRFGSDALYGSVPADTYVTVPSWQKINRNAKLRIEEDPDDSSSYITASSYDNENVVHQIPQSSRQYSWITASVPTSAGLFDFVGFSASYNLASIPAITQSEANVEIEDVPINFAGYAFTEDAHRNVNLSTHILENANYVSNAHSLFLSGTRDLVADSPIYEGGTGNIWGPIVGGSGNDALPFSVSFWMYYTGLGGTTDDGRIITWNQPGHTTSFRRIILDDDTDDPSPGPYNPTLGMQIDSASGAGNDGYVFTGTGVISPNTWYHCVLTFAGGSNNGGNLVAKAYIDGAIDGTANSKTVSNPSPVLNGNVTIGNRNNGTRPFNGYLDELQVWNKELSSAEISDLYDRRGFNLFGYEPSVNNLVSWWRTGDTPGDSADLIQDVQGFANLVNVSQATVPAENYQITTFVPRANENDQSFINEHQTTLNLNGPYQYPSWKQSRTGQHAVAREMRENNIISTMIRVTESRPSEFIDYTEAPLGTRYAAAQFQFEDNTPSPNPANNVTLNVAYTNNLDYFSNESLNNRLGLYQNANQGNAFNVITNTTAIGSSLSSIISYGERVYPREKFVYQNRVRGRDTYQIADIWNASRLKRLVSASNSQGFIDAANLEYEADSSPWPLDPNYVFSQTIYPSNATVDNAQPPYASTGSGAGELQNPYCRFGYAGTDTLHPATCYVMPFPGALGENVGESETDFLDPYVLQGFVPWSTHNDAALEPYTPYVDFAKNIRVKGKDHTVIPEFRISELMYDYVVSNNSNFLTTFNNMFSLTGSSVGNSSVADFYSIYSQADFMKYFSTVDNQFVNQTNASGLPITRKRLTLSCNALLKFLPYKGFYPAERTVELGSLLSKSLGTFTGGDTDQDERVMSRVLLEPLYAPGIMYNTIKSGIAVSNFVVQNTSSSPAFNLQETAGTGDTDYTEYNFNGESTINKSADINKSALMGLHLKDSASADHDTRGYYLHPLPFEALRDPESYLGKSALPTDALYDTGVYSSSLAHIMTDSSYDNGYDNNVTYEGIPDSQLYKLGVDNFLCETVNFFQPSLKNYLSKEETEFLPLQEGSYYGMEIRLYRPLAGSTTSPANDDGFGMYSRASAFGAPVVVSASGGGSEEVTFSHVTPPYYNGNARAYIIYSASASGRPTVDDLLANAVIEYDRAVDYPSSFTPDIKTLPMQISSSVNLLDKLLVVPPATTTQTARWLVQTKFETPVLNFWGVDVQTLPTGANGTSPVDPSNSTNPFQIRGMWHQYGSIPTGGDGLYLALNPLPSNITSTNYGAIQVESLIDKVGFEVTMEKKIGEVNDSKVIEEAIVAIPFTTDNNQRQFFQINISSDRYILQQALLGKYVFPPTFDYVANPTVAPIAFYAFEFTHTLSQEDLINMWQNLPPQINSNFSQATDSIIIEDLVNEYLDVNSNLEWMIFKVKRKAKKDYNLFVKQDLVEGDLIQSPSITSPYSYNWPYDYFSLVELIKIDEEIQYATQDLL